MPEGQITRKCRTCLRNSTKTFALNKLATGCKENETLGQLLQEYANLEYAPQYESLMPQHLCAHCCRDLTKAYTFIRQAQYCNNKLINVIAKQLCGVQEENAIVVDRNVNNTLESSCDIKLEKDVQLNHTNIIRNEFRIVNPNVLLKSEILEELSENATALQYYELEDIENAEIKDNHQDSMLTTLNVSNIDDNTAESSGASIVCPICDKIISTYNNLITHIRVQHDIKAPEKILKMQSHDEEIINSKSNLKMNFSNTHHNERIKFKCKFCSHISNKKIGVLMHIRKAHKKFVKILKANKTEQGELLNETTAANSKTFQDVDNAGEVNSNTSLEQQQQVQQNDDMFDRNIKKRSPVYRFPTKYAPAKCDTCGKLYRNFRALKTHQEAVHISEDKYCVCSECGKKFKNKSNLRVHIKNAHTPKTELNIVQKSPKPKVKRFMCAQCSYACTTLNTLNIHMKRNHTGEQPHKCDICSKTFVVKFDLKTHRYLHTGERPYKCTFCPKSFRNSSQLLKHKRIHSNERPYKCQDCGKSFTQSYNLTLHKRTHLKEKNLNCTVCGKLFDNPSLLNMHRINENHYDEVV